MDPSTPDPIVIVGSARTPIGSFLGNLSLLRAPDLGSIVIKAALTRAKVKPEEIDEIIMGCVLSAGLGQAPARQAALNAGLPNSVHASTLNKVCGSGMKAIMLANDLLRLDNHKIMLAGGMESMSNAPFLVDKIRKGHRLGSLNIQDHMLLDGLEDAYEKGKAMGIFAERTAEKYHFSRKTQDEFALTSLTRAQTATKNGWFLSDYEITPTPLRFTKTETEVMETDECPLHAKAEKIPLLKPVFKENGTTTAASSSSISDGAAAVVLMRESEAMKRQLTPIAKILAHASFSQDPAWFSTAVIGVIQILLKKLQWTTQDVDLFEINEAFASVPLAAMQDLKLSSNKVNVHGGACALGHPIGASGARIICTLLGALKQQQKKTGIAALCIGGGEATAIAIELY